MMPYIIVTKRTPLGSPPGGLIHRVSRRAVATLDEARRIAEARAEDERDRQSGFGEEPDDSPVLAARNLPEQGGTVTLPDGTVIEVEYVDQNALGMMAGLRGSSKGAVAAYNAAQEGDE